MQGFQCKGSWKRFVDWNEEQQDAHRIRLFLDIFQLLKECIKVIHSSSRSCVVRAWQAAQQWYSQNQDTCTDRLQPSQRAGSLTLIHANRTHPYTCTLRNSAAQTVNGRCPTPCSRRENAKSQPFRVQDNWVLSALAKHAVVTCHGFAQLVCTRSRMHEAHRLINAELHAIVWLREVAI